MIKNQLTLAVSLFLAGLFVLPSCKKYVDQSNPPGFIAPDELVKASLQGRVLDENGLPVKGASVTSGTSTTTTDVNGVFSFSNIDIYSRFGFVKVVKAGYFTGSRTILTNPGALNYVRIDLLPRSSKGTFSASSGGKITVQTGDSVAFDGGAVVNASNNAAYSGTVHVYASYLDPTDGNLSKQMPGDLRGVRTDGKETGLQSFGMMVVELEGDAGEKLQIASGKKATLSMAIPASLQASAPATIPLWYFNDSTGKWIEEGTGTRQGNTYIGQVGHFSFWNYDAPYDLVYFKVHLKDQHGNPLAYTYLRFVPPTANYGLGHGYTDSSGFAQGLIPKGQDLLLQIFSSCNSVIFGTSVGPALNDQDLGTITITINNAALTLKGTVVDCNNNPVANGYVNAYLDGLNYRGAVTNGIFSMNINRCNNTTTGAELTAGDFSVSQSGTASTVTVNSGIQDAGQLSACGISIDQFISVTVNGTAYYVTTPPSNVSYFYQNPYGNFLANSTDPVSGNMYLHFGIKNLTGTGTYPVDFFSMYKGNKAFGLDGTGLQSTITGFGPINGYITGSLNGTIRDSISKVNYPATGSFKVMRAN